MRWPNVSRTKLTLVVLAAAAASALLLLTGSAHVYAYFVAIVSAAPLLRLNGTTAGALWCGLVMVWWNVAVVVTPACGVTAAFYIILVECISRYFVLSAR